MQIETRIIESRSAKLFTSVYPNKSADSVILLHGGPGVPMDLSDIADLLSCKYQVVTFDQRGTRRSPVQSEDYSMDEYVGDLDAVCSRLGLDRFHLFGHSWGGLYAQIYAEKRSAKILSLFLCSPGSGTGEVWRQTEREIFLFNKERCTRSGWLKMGFNSLLGMLGSDRASQSLFKQVVENYNKGFDESWAVTDSMFENVCAKPANKTRSKIRRYQPLKDTVYYPFPVMITYGDKDIYGESRQKVLRRFPGARYVELKNSGHFPWRQSPEEFIKTFSEFYGLPVNHLLPHAGAK